jgi:hypothetical protein
VCERLSAVISTKYATIPPARELMIHKRKSRLCSALNSRHMVPSGVKRESRSHSDSPAPI